MIGDMDEQTSIFNEFEIVTLKFSIGGCAHY